MPSEPLLLIDDSEPGLPAPGAGAPPWPILVVDDDEGVHWVTRMVLRNLLHAGRPVVLLGAHSAAEAKAILQQRRDVALILLDVVMETVDAGLRLIPVIREELGLRATRIILRTGQPGHAPEVEVILNYDINDYRSKTELTAQHLITSTVAALRAYSHITDLEAANANLEQARLTAELANRAKSAFLATVSHELKTPLNAVIGFAELISCQALGPVGHPDYLEYAASILDSGRRLLTVIGDILDLSSLELGEVPLELDYCNLALTLGTCLELVQSKAEAGGLSLALSVPPEQPEFITDIRRLKQIVLNLLDNAVKFTAPGGRVSLAAAGTSDGSGVVLTVADSGIGMSAEQIPLALSAFRQLDDGLSRRFEGAGLGLPLVKSLTELLGGTLALDSTPGVGTTVSLHFPLQPPRPEAAVTQNCAPPGPEG